MPQTGPELRTVMIVEDDLVLSRLMAEIVQGFGLDVVLANSAARAIQLTEEEEPYDLLLSDVVLENGSTGFKLAETLRQARPELPVLYMSGVTDYSAEEIGSVQAPILKKPIPVDDLEQALTQAFRLT